MQISMEEVGRILQSQLKARETGQEPHRTEVDASIEGLTTTDSPDVYTRSEEVQRVKDLLDESPDVREDLVQAIKARIESGTYHVSGEDIADLMVRRAFADTIK